MSVPKMPKRQRKGEIKEINAVKLNEEQKIAHNLVFNNQIVIITGRAGSGKSLVCAQVALDLYEQEAVSKILNTRSAIEVGRSLGFLPGDLANKFDPYMEAFLENLHKCCTRKEKIEDMIATEKIKAMPVQFIRGKTVDDILIVEEAQNLTKPEMLAILTRLGGDGRIVINGDFDQTDIKENGDGTNGLKYVVELSKKIPEIKRIDLKANHRSDLVGKILDYEYSK